MPNPWFRLYSEFAVDPKVQMLSEALQRRLVMLFCERCKCETLQETERAFHWRITIEELQKTKQVFVEKEFIDEEWNLTNWNKRQFLSDSSTDRVRRYRQGLKQDETLLKQDETFDATKCNGPEQSRTEQSRTEQIRVDASRGKANGKYDGLVPLSSISLKGLPRRPTFPSTVPGLVEAGWVLSNRRLCRDCGIEIDWWKTPKGGDMPMNADSAIVHMETCGK